MANSHFMNIRPLSLIEIDALADESEAKSTRHKHNEIVCIHQVMKTFYQK